MLVEVAAVKHATKMFFLQIFTLKPFKKKKILGNQFLHHCGKFVESMETLQHLKVPCSKCHLCNNIGELVR